MTVGNLAGGVLADRSVRRTMYAFFGVLIVALAALALSATTVAGLLVGVFLIGAAASAISPTIQTRLMDVAHDSQPIAAALNHSALNIGNALGAYLGGIAIAAGLGYVAPVWIGFGLSLCGVALAVVTFAIDRARRQRGADVPYGTQGIAVVRAGSPADAA
jgi:DHA1 family inner membrane transport protein